MHTLETLIRERIARLSQEKVAANAEMKPCTVSRILSGAQGLPLDKLGLFLEAVGLEIVASDSDEVRVSRDKWRALNLLAREDLEGGE